MIFASTILYSLAKKLGGEAAHVEFMRQVQVHSQTESRLGLVNEQWHGIPAAATVARIALIDPETECHVDTGGTVIGKCRSVAAHAFRESQADIWFQVDDDCEVSRGALEGMAEQARAEPCIVIAPCFERESGRVSIRRKIVDVQFSTASGCTMQPIEGGAFSCVVMSRAVIEKMPALAGSAPFTGPDGITRLALFRDRVEDGQWWTEDLAFCRDAGVHFPIYAVRRGTTKHAGLEMDLATLEAPRAHGNGGAL